MSSPGLGRGRGSSDNFSNVFDDAKTYYASDERHLNSRAGPRQRTYSQNGLQKQFARLGLKEPFRRGSHDEASSNQGRRFLIDVDSTLDNLQSQEDTDGNMQITIEDSGPKVL